MLLCRYVSMLDATVTCSCGVANQTKPGEDECFFCAAMCVCALALARKKYILLKCVSSFKYNEPTTCKNNTPEWQERERKQQQQHLDVV